MSSKVEGRQRRERSRSRDRGRSYRDDRRPGSRERDFDRGDYRSSRLGREEGEIPSSRRSRSPTRRRSTSPRRSGSRSHNRRRSRSRSRSVGSDHHKNRRRDYKRSRSRSRSVSSSSSSSSDEKRHKKKHKHHKRKRSRSRDREKKERKKEKKDKKKKKSSVISHQWGKYGIINETDLYNKEAEFRAWLVEERKINPETISKDQTKKEFARFVEDFNTATLPHEKFYNIASYETRMTALRAGEYLPPQDDGYDPNADMRALQGTHKRKNKDSDTYMTRDQLLELRKVQAERIEVGKMKLLGMDIKQNMGVRMDGTSFDDF